MCRVIHRFKSSIRSKISEELDKYDKLEVHLDKQKRINYKNSLKTNKRILLYLWLMFMDLTLTKNGFALPEFVIKQPFINL